MKRYSDFYAFGSQKPGRNDNPGEYRYGFNGKETESEITGTESHLDYGARIYDSRMGRFLSLDPMDKYFAFLSPYSYAANTPVWAADDGNRPIFKTRKEAEYITEDLNRLFRARFNIAADEPDPLYVTQTTGLVREYKNNKMVKKVVYTINTNSVYNWDTMEDGGHASALYDFINMNATVFIHLEKEYKGANIKTQYGGGKVGDKSNIYISSELTRKYGDPGTMAFAASREGDEWTPGIVFFHEATYHILGDPVNPSKDEKDHDPNDLRREFKTVTGNSGDLVGTNLNKPGPKERENLDKKKKRTGRGGKRKADRVSF